jgi:hypothetical protein
MLLMVETTTTPNPNHGADDMADLHTSPAPSNTHFGQYAHSAGFRVRKDEEGEMLFCRPGTHPELLNQYLAHTNRRVVGDWSPCLGSVWAPVAACQS